ncbi:hypothetical protein ACFWV1_26115 [Streptomyces sp. NPDC058700]|uniref:hypothetical protein n=1 Tax=Streptomyces sp. NPDC058700 TaxID=3346607 RepID=UPI003655403D
MNSGDTTTPAERLRLLHTEYLTPGPARQAERVTKSSEPSTPIRLGVYDHIKATVDELISLAKDNRDGRPAGPRPPRVEDAYRWAVEETAHLDGRRARVRDAVIYRQGLEHAILMGDSKVVRRHACPGCDTWGLIWDRAQETVVCLNRYCADDDGQHRTWTLAEVAEVHILRQARVASRAT